MSMQSEEQTETGREWERGGRGKWRVWSGGNTFRRFVRGICRLELLWATRVALPTLDSLGCPASRASIIIIVMTSTLLSAGSGRNPARDGPTRLRVWNLCVCGCLCVIFFCVLKDFFLCLRAVVSSGELESCRAVGYFMCVQLSGWSCRLSSPSSSPPSTLPCSDRFRFVSVHISTRLLQLLPGMWGRAALSGLNYVFAALPPLPLYWVPSAAELVLSVWP